MVNFLSSNHLVHVSFFFLTNIFIWVRQYNETSRLKKQKQKVGIHNSKKQEESYEYIIILSMIHDLIRDMILEKNQYESVGESRYM